MSKRKTAKTPEGLVMVQRPDRVEMGGDSCETWDLDVPGLMIWIKRYSAKVDATNPFSGWRVGVGCSPTTGYNSFAAALKGVCKQAQHLATWRLTEKRKEYTEAVGAARKVGLNVVA